MPHRVVVTGMGVVSPLGCGVDIFWDRLIRGDSGVERVTLFDTSGLNRHYAAEVKDIFLTRFCPSVRPSRLPRSHQLALAASSLALKDAGLHFRHLSAVGVSIGSLGSGLEFIEREAKRFAYYPVSSLAASVCNLLGLGGLSHVSSGACAAGNYAIITGYERIRDGRCRVMLCGGADHLALSTFIGFCRLVSIAPAICQPFDKHRQGLIPSEGAGMLVLEDLASALGRNAHIHAEIIGYGVSCDAYHPVAPSADGIFNCVKSALEDADISTRDVDYINAHGTGTQLNDKVECLAYKRLFANRLRRVPISSLKSMLGHAMGASSAVEAISCCLSLERGIIPPTMHYKTPDPECDIDCVPNRARRKRVDIVLNNAFGFGGINASVVFKRYEAST